MRGPLTLPGLIDCHVHFREPGLTHKEDLVSGTAAALAGGITTVCDMPNTNPPTCTVNVLRKKVRRWQEIRNSDIEIRNVGAWFFFGVTKKEHRRELEEVMDDTELRPFIPGVKLYLDHSTGDQGIDPSIVEDVFHACTELQLPLVVHAEDPTINASSRSMRNDVSAHSECRPPESEARAVACALEFSRRHGTHLHIAHLSSLQGLSLMREAKNSGMPVTCEVAPHHLFLTVEDYAYLGTLAKINPPLRTHDHCEALWEGVLDGAVDCVASDHAPHTLMEKRVQDWKAAPSGVPGVETMVSLLLSCVFGNGPIDSQGHSRLPTANCQLPLATFRKLFFDNPNHIFHLGRDPQAPPQISIEPEAEWVISGQELHSKCNWTPYEGWIVQGKVSHCINY